MARENLKGYNRYRRSKIALKINESKCFLSLGETTMILEQRECKFFIIQT